MTARITLDNYNLNDDFVAVSKDKRSYGTKVGWAGGLKRQKPNGDLVTLTFTLIGAHYNGWFKSDYDKVQANKASCCLSWPVDSVYGKKIKQLSDDIVKLYNTDDRAKEIRKLKKVDSVPIIPPIKLSNDGKHYNMWVSVSPDPFLDEAKGKTYPGTMVASKDKKGKVHELSIKAFEHMEFEANFAEVAFELAGDKNYIRTKLFTLITGDKFKKIVFGSKDDLYSQIITQADEEGEGVVDISSILNSEISSGNKVISSSAAAGEDNDEPAISIKDFKMAEPSTSDDEEGSSGSEPPKIINPTNIASKTSSVKVKK